VLSSLVRGQHANGGNSRGLRCPTTFTAHSGNLMIKGAYCKQKCALGMEFQEVRASRRALESLR
jgi:hypothetical protein